MGKPKFFFKRKDGGDNSTVTGFWLVEWKSVFSLVLLKFDKGSREAFHNHAFHALTWWIWGKADEHMLDGSVKTWTPSLWPKLTKRSDFHKVYGVDTTYAVSFRGPWSKTWKEFLPAEDKFVTLTNGRRVVNE
jgi:hypothetical protein